MTARQPHITEGLETLSPAGCGTGKRNGCNQNTGFPHSPKDAMNGLGDTEPTPEERAAKMPCSRGAQQGIQMTGRVVLRQEVVTVKVYPCPYCDSMKTSRTGQYRDKGIQYRACENCGKSYPVKLSGLGAERSME